MEKAPDSATVNASSAEQLKAEAEQARIRLEELEAEYEATVKNSDVNQEDRDSLRILVEQSRGHHVSLQHALERQESGSYGICESCGGEISAERLEAVPDTEFCRDCST